MRICLEKKIVPYLQHLSTSADLITAPEDIRAGFVALALERTRQATPFVEQARALKISSMRAKSPNELLNIEEIRAALLTAAGFSEKASTYTDETDQTTAIQNFIERFLEPAGTNFVEELVYRFLLTRGDSLGGSMRNIAGKLAERKVNRAIISALTLTETTYQWLNAASNTWIDGTRDGADIELSLKALSWKKDKEIRTLIYNRTIPLVGKNIDMCLLHCTPDEVKPATYRIPEKFIAFGELKGGIDPAGADEHWKTAQTALTRIKTAFGNESLSPNLFFIGAVIVDSMAQEIWDQLADGTLKNAANLTDLDQVASLANWLVDL
jgi:type II restriction enzyme